MSSTESSRLYCIVHQDLPLAQQAVQATHAALEHAFVHGRPPTGHPALVVLTVKNQEQLQDLRYFLKQKGIQISDFHESYKNWGLTALACLLKEEERSLLSDLPLWKIKPSLGDQS